MIHDASKERIAGGTVGAWVNRLDAMLWHELDAGAGAGGVGRWFWSAGFLGTTATTGRIWWGGNVTPETRPGESPSVMRRTARTTETPAGDDGGRIVISVMLKGNEFEICY